MQNPTDKIFCGRTFQQWSYFAAMASLVLSPSLGLGRPIYHIKNWGLSSRRYICYSNKAWCLRNMVSQVIIACFLTKLGGSPSVDSIIPPRVQKQAIRTPADKEWTNFKPLGLPTQIGEDSSALPHEKGLHCKSPFYLAVCRAPANQTLWVNRTDAIYEDEDRWVAR